MTTLKNRLYESSPVGMQHLAASYQGYLFRVKRASSKEIALHLQRLLQSEQWTEDKLNAFRVNALRATLASAGKTTRYYSKLFSGGSFEPSRIDTLSALSQLPLLEKSAVRGHEEDFINREVSRGSLYVGGTSGTTGAPMKWFESRSSFSRRTAFIARLRYWAGLADPLFPRRAQFTGRQIVPRTQVSKVFWRHNIPGNSLLFSATHLSVETVPLYLQRLARLKPHLMDGYPSAFLILMRVAKALDLELPKIPVIICTAEMLSEPDRLALAEAFGAKVFDQYSSSEPSCFWSTCEYGTLHEHVEYGVSEILDHTGKPVDYGETGEIVTTSFLNPNMPLIRYRIGDLAVRADKNAVCKCGRSLPIIGKVLGREDDILYFPKRGYIGRLSIFRDMTNVVEAQAIQEELEHLRILVVPSPEFSIEDEYRIIDLAKARIGSEVQVSVTKVAKINRSANGKFKNVVSRVSHLYPLNI